MYKAMKMMVIIIFGCLDTGTCVFGSSLNTTLVCDGRCTVCVEYSHGLFNAYCRLGESSAPLSPFVLFSSLDLSNNGLRRIPREFLANQSRLTKLSIALNDISTIDEDGFGRLPQVTFVNVSHNHLWKWEGDVARQLPKLAKLDVTGNTWIPDENVLQMPSLKSITGVSWSSDCANCTLNKRNITFPVNLSQEALDNNIAMKFVRYGFFPSCASAKCGAFDIFANRTRTRTITENVRVARTLFYTSYIMGAIAIVLNLTILLTVLLSKALRKTTSMLLITNMAICDLFIGVYSVIIGNLNIFNFLHSAYNTHGAQKLVLGGGVLCPVATVIFTSGESVASVTSLLLTVEKYCSIVHCMNPDHRMSRKVAVLILLPCWMLSVAFAVLPLLQVSSLTFSATLMCSLPVAEKTSFLIGLGILVALYIVNIPLYVIIFLFVRGSGSRLGIKRETTILKKIALVVCTNFVLLVTPMVLLITFVPTRNIHNTIVVKGAAQDTQVLYIVGYWLPIACLGLNACVNPLLCAFRQGQFRKEFRHIFQACSRTTIRDMLSSSRLEGLSSQWNASTSQIVLQRVTWHDACSSASG